MLQCAVVRAVVCCSVLNCVAVCCIVLQCVAVFCSLPLEIEERRSALWERACVARACIDALRSIIEDACFGGEASPV